MPMYNLIECCNNYAKTGNLWPYHKDIPNDNKGNCESFNFKAKITGRTPANGNTKNVEIVVPLEYFSNFWRSCEINI